MPPDGASWHAAARRFFEKTMRENGEQEKIAMDKSGANRAAIDEINGGKAVRITVRQVKYLNNIVEQDHRNIKSRLGAMLGLKSFVSAAITIRGVELMHRILKRQFDLHVLGTQGQTPSETWAAVLAA